MFGVKTQIKKQAKRLFSSLTAGRLSSDIAVRYLMDYFKADVYGHQADIKKADLGYGWIHYAFVRTLKPRRILCIGSRYGFIPAVLAQACKDNSFGHVDFVDPGYGPEDKDHWTGEGYWRSERGKASFKNYGLGGWLTLYVKTSFEFAKKNRAKYEYIYVDGNHSYEGVSLDYKLFWPKLKPYGFMAFHDVNVKGRMPEGLYGVHKLWRTYGEKHALLLPFKGSGLGIIQKI